MKNYSLMRSNQISRKAVEDYQIQNIEELSSSFQIKDIFYKKDNSLIPINVFILSFFFFFIFLAFFDIKSTQIKRGRKFSD